MVIHHQATSQTYTNRPPPHTHTHRLKKKRNSIGFLDKKPTQGENLVLLIFFLLLISLTLMVSLLTTPENTPATQKKGEVMLPSSGEVREIIDKATDRVFLHLYPITFRTITIFQQLPVELLWKGPFRTIFKSFVALEPNLLLGSVGEWHIQAWDEGGSAVLMAGQLPWLVRALPPVISHVPPFFHFFVALLKHGMVNVITLCNMLIFHIIQSHDEMVRKD